MIQEERQKNEERTTQALEAQRDKFQVRFIYVHILKQMLIF